MTVDSTGHPADRCGAKYEAFSLATVSDTGLTHRPGRAARTRTRQRDPAARKTWRFAIQKPRMASYYQHQQQHHPVQSQIRSSSENMMRLRLYYPAACVTIDLGGQVLVPLFNLD